MAAEEHTSAGSSCNNGHGWPLAPKTINCLVCGTPFPLVVNRRGRYPRLCSDACRAARRAQHHLAYRNDGRYRDRPRERRWRDFVCRECGASFRRQQSKASICSADCQAEMMRRIMAARPPQPRKFATKADRHRHHGYLRKALAASAETERFSATEIFERDGWRCGICGGEVDRRLKWPNPKSASVDHIQPISQGGKHVRANVQCAHLTCNSRKSAGAGGQLRLFG